MALGFLVPQLQVPLGRAIVGLVALFATSVGVTAHVEPLVRSLLFGH